MTFTAHSRLFTLFLFCAAIAFSAGTASAQSGPYSFYSVTPCRAVDTRGGSPVGTGETRSFVIRGSCNVPSTAAAVSINVTVASATTASFLTIWPAGTTRPVVSTINFTQNDPTLANGAIVGLGSGSPDLSVYNSDGTVHVIIDITGYFQ